MVYDWDELEGVNVFDTAPLLVIEDILVAMSAIVVLVVKDNALPRALLTILLLALLKETKSLLRIN